MSLRTSPVPPAGGRALAAPLLPEVWEQAKRCSAVLSCGRSQLAMAEHPPGIYSCFSPLLPLLKHFVSSSLQPCRLSSPGMAPPLSAGSGELSAWDWLLPSSAWPSPVRQRMFMGCWPGGRWRQRAQRDTQQQGPSLARAPEGAALLWHGGREGLANRMRSCGTSQHPPALV